MFCDRREEIIFAGVEDCAVSSSTRSDDPHHFAPYEFLARTWLFHLIADGDFEAAANQARDVAFGGVVRNAAHGNRLALFAVARRERNLKLARRDDGVFVKQFVEIAQAEKQQGVRVARLDGVILLHQRCCRLAHSVVVSRSNVHARGGVVRRSRNESGASAILSELGGGRKPHAAAEKNRMAREKKLSCGSAMCVRFI